VIKEGVNAMAASFLQAASSGDLVLLKAEYNEDFKNFEDADGKGALHCAAMEGHLDVVAWLLSEKFPVNAQNKKGLTPLHYSAYRGFLSVARALVEAGADASIRDVQNRSALHLACTVGSIEVICFLCEELYQSPYSEPASDGMNCAHFAALGGHKVVLEWLWDLPEEGSDSGRALCSGRQSDGMQPLHFAVMKGHMDAVVWLVESAGVDINAGNDKGRTPLHLAVAASSTILVTYLLNAGADARKADKEGMTPAALSRGIAAGASGVTAQAGADDVRDILSSALSPPTAPANPPVILTANGAQELADGDGQSAPLPPPGWGKEGDRVYVRWAHAQSGLGSPPTTEYALQFAASRSSLMSLGVTWKDCIIYEGASSSPTVSSTTSRTHACLGGLLPGTGYVFRVRGRNANGWGSWTGKSDEIITAGSVSIPLSLPGTNSSSLEVESPISQPNNAPGDVTAAAPLFAGLAVRPLIPGGVIPHQKTSPIAAILPPGTLDIIPPLGLPIIEAAAAGDVETLKSILSANSHNSLLGSDSGNSRNLLHHAAHGLGASSTPPLGQCPTLAWLLSDSGGNLPSSHLYARDSVGATPLLLAVVAGSLAAVKYLAAKGANLNTPDSKGFTPLHYAAIKSRPSIFRWLLESGVEVGAKTLDGRSVRDVVESNTGAVREELRMLLGNSECVPLAPPPPIVLDASATSIALVLPLPKWAPGSRLPYAYEVQCANRSGFSAALTISWTTCVEVSPTGLNICAPSYCSGGNSAAAATSGAPTGGLQAVVGTQGCGSIPTSLLFTPSIVIIQGLAGDKRYAFQIRSLSLKGPGLWSERTIDIATPSAGGSGLSGKSFCDEIVSGASATSAASSALVSSLKSTPSSASHSLISSLAAIKLLKPPSQSILLALKGEKFVPGALPPPSQPTPKSPLNDKGEGEFERLIILAGREGGLCGLQESPLLSSIRLKFTESENGNELRESVGEKSSSNFYAVLSSAAFSGDFEAFKWLIGEDGFAPPPNLRSMLSGADVDFSSVPFAAALGGLNNGVLSHLVGALGGKNICAGGALHGASYAVSSSSSPIALLDCIKRALPGGEADIVEACREWMGALGKKERKGWTPLHYAVLGEGGRGGEGFHQFLSFWSKDTLTAWLSETSDEAMGVSPAHIAAALNSTASLHSLKKIRADSLWIKDSGGLAPIHYAAAADAGASVAYLLWASRELGVSCANSQDSLRRTPKDVAIEAGALEAKKILESWGQLRDSV